VSHISFPISLLFILFIGVDVHLRCEMLMIASDKPNTPAVTEQVSEQVVSVCMALGVSREHAELVIRVMAACTNQADADVGQGL
jgi:hypothetical protein